MYMCVPCLAWLVQLVELVILNLGVVGSSHTLGVVYSVCLSIKHIRIFTVDGEKKQKQTP